MAKKNQGTKTPVAVEETKQVEQQDTAQEGVTLQSTDVQETAQGVEGADQGTVEETTTAPAQETQAEETAGQDEEEPAAPEVEETEEPNPDEPVQVLVSTSMALLQQELAEYIEAMRPGREVSANDGMLMQVKLNALIKSVLRQEGEEFISQMKYLLAAFEEHRGGVFGERYVFRFVDTVPLSRGDRTALERLVNLFMVTADAKSRQDALKHVDLAKVAETLQDGKMQERLFQFYSM